MTEELRGIFDRLAPSWYNYRHHTIFRHELEALAASWAGGRLLNLGCGHGADFLPFCQGFELHGLDFSGGMLVQAIRYAQKFGFEVNLARADITALPYDDGSFDFAIAVASYHHLTTAHRLPAFLELKRVLKPGGFAFITVWNRWQARFRLKREVLVPWRTKDQVLNRYYNLFSYGDLTRLAEDAGFEVVRVSPENTYRWPFRRFSRNICLLATKPPTNK